FQEFFEIDHATAEEGLGFGLGDINRLEQRGLAVHHSHATAAASGRRLDDDRVTDLAGDGQRAFLVVIDGAVGAWHGGNTGLAHHVDGGDLVSHQPDGFGARTDEYEATLLDLFGEVGILRQEAVAGVNRHRIGDFRGADDGRHIEVTEGGIGGANTDRLVGQPHVHQVAVGAGVNGDSLDAQLLAGPEDTKSDLATVGNKHFIKHGRILN